MRSSGSANTATIFAGGKRILDQVAGVFIPVHDIDLLAAQLFYDSIDTGTVHTDTGADCVYVGIIAPYSDLGTAASLTGDTLDLYNAVADFCYFFFKQTFLQAPDGYG